jgi:UDP-galactopyranose mutase
MAVGLSSNLEPSLVVYDCMDELSAFLAAPPALQHREAELFRRADIVFTGGHSLYEAKRGRHPNVHAFPSSVDTEHFQSARRPAPEDAERKGGRPARVGYFGVLDERLDVPLLDGVASACPDIEMVLVGPVVKIDPATLPKRPNLHYLGPKLYSELPSIIASWDAAMMPFARNDATRFISPTKTLEYMAAGKPIVSTSIRDVVRPYGEQGLVRIADDATSFARAIAEALSEDTSARLAAFDAFLAHTSWDRTWRGMRSLIDAAFAARGKARRRGCRLETA